MFFFAFDKMRHQLAYAYRRRIFTVLFQFSGNPQSFALTLEVTFSLVSASLSDDP